MEELFEAKLEWSNTKVGDIVQTKEGERVKICSINHIDYHGDGKLFIKGLGVNVEDEGKSTMELGSKEWFNKINENHKFPENISFYITSGGSLNSKVIDSKAMLNNLAYRFVRPAVLFDDTEQALVSVIHCEHAEAYYNEVVRIKKVWDDFLTKKDKHTLNNRGWRENV